MSSKAIVIPSPEQIRPVVANQMAAPAWLTPELREAATTTVVERRMKPKDACKSHGVTEAQYQMAFQAYRTGNACAEIADFFDALDRAYNVDLKYKFVDAVAENLTAENAKWLAEKFFSSEFGKQEVLKIVNAELDAVMARADIALESGTITVDEYSKFMLIIAGE